MFKFIRKLRGEKDSGNSVLVTFILATPLIAMICGLAIDFALSGYLSNLYNNKAQSAVQSSIREIDARGALGEESVKKLVKEFEAQTSGGIKNAQTSENAGYESEICQTAKINGIERNLPYYEVKLSTARGETGVKSAKIKVIDNVVPDLKINRKYQAISADIYTSHQNIMFGMFGMPCQVHKTSVGAIAFGSDSDLK